MREVVVKVVNKSGNKLPEYQTEGAACLDISADKEMSIGPGTTVVVPTGLYVEIPEGYQIKVVPRSGLAARSSVTVLNSPGTIDSDYRGEIGIIIHNNGSNYLQVDIGDRIAQLELQEVIRIKWEPVLLLTETQRGDGAFGSTGR